MKLTYYEETDSLYIELIDRPSVESEEVAEGIVLDYDAEGRLVGMDIDNCVNKINLRTLVINSLPSLTQNAAA